MDETDGSFEPRRLRDFRRFSLHEGIERIVLPVGLIAGYNIRARQSGLMPLPRKRTASLPPQA
jgi:hypothetical protein